MQMVYGMVIVWRELVGEPIYDDELVDEPTIEVEANWGQSFVLWRM